MIVLTQSHLSALSAFAEESYPSECCGLLAGTGDAEQEILVTRVVPSDNVSSTDTRDSFEVDPKVRFGLMRELEETDERIVGHYHSHPDHPAEPSDTDVSMIYEPELFWLIISSDRNGARDIRAFQPSPDATAFTPIQLRTTQG